LNRSNIEWTEATWNPVTGCSKISSGCKYCYAERWALMQEKRGISQYRNGFSLTLAPERLNDPKKWQTPKLIFVNSMSDLFHEEIPEDYIRKVFQVMNDTPRHTYQILTKRIERVKKICSELTWSNNIWLGVSVEKNDNHYRVDILKRIPSQIKFISYEPLLELINQYNYENIDWVLVGGESGGKARKMEEGWALSLKNTCLAQKVPFFFKQWGKKENNPNHDDPTINKSSPMHAKGGCMLNGEFFRNYPKIKQNGTAFKYR